MLSQKNKKANNTKTLGKFGKAWCKWKYICISSINIKAIENHTPLVGVARLVRLSLDSLIGRVWLDSIGYRQAWTVMIWAVQSHESFGKEFFPLAYGYL